MVDPHAERRDDESWGDLTAEPREGGFIRGSIHSHRKLFGHLFKGERDADAGLRLPRRWALGTVEARPSDGKRIPRLPFDPWSGLGPGLQAG